MSTQPELPSPLLGVDLNLLVALDALIQTESVTLAAHRMGISQSAMSHTLRRLRDLFDDPLLVRSGSSMVLTTRASGLAAPLRGRLDALARLLLAPDAFDPSTANRTFSIAGPELFMLIVVPRLLGACETLAPCLDFNLLPADATTHADVVVQAHVDRGQTITPASGFVHRALYRDTLRCFARRGHPAIRSGEISLEDYLWAPHVDTESGGLTAMIDDQLAPLRLSRRIQLRVPQMAALGPALRHSDLLTTAPASLTHVVGPEVISVPNPLPLPGQVVTLAWQNRLTTDPAHVWLRTLLVELMAIPLTAF